MAALHLIPSEKSLKTQAEQAEARRISDGGGLYLLRLPNGSKAWRFDYTHAARRKTLSLGVWPGVTLAQARKKASEARDLVRNGADPSAARKAGRAEARAVVEAERRAAAGLPSPDSVEAIARDWLARIHSKLVTPAHFARNVRRLERHIFPKLGRRPLREVTPPDLLKVLREVEEAGAIETAHRVRDLFGAVARFAIASGMADRDPAADLRGALPPPAMRHHPAPTEPHAVAELVRLVWSYRGLTLTGPALRLLLLTGQRPGEVRAAQWSEIDLSAQVWTIPAARMKGKAARKAGPPHIVPLEGEALSLLRELQENRDGSEFVFPSLRGAARPLSDAALGVALRAMAVPPSTFVPHGARAILRTLAREALDFPPDVLEAHLAHAPAGPLGSAYDRAAHLIERRRLMACWSAYLAALRDGAEPAEAASRAKRVRPDKG